jgi:hypothetical protein
MIVTESSEKIEITVVTALDHLLVVQPGLRPPEGRLMIEGLQGTIEGKTEDATRRRNATKKGRPGTQTGMAVGPVRS